MSPQMGIWTAEDDAAAIAAHAAILDAHMPDMFQTLRTGEYMHLFPVSSWALVAIVANRLYGVPFLVVRALTVDRIAIRVTIAAGAGTVARLGIYNLGANLYPGTLLLDAGTVAVDAAGVKTIIINQALTPGIYFAAIVSDAAPTIVHHRLTFSPLGLAPDNFQQHYEGWEVAFPLAVLPDPFPAAAALFRLESPSVVLRLLSLD